MGCSPGIVATAAMHDVDIVSEAMGDDVHSVDDFIGLADGAFDVAFLSLVAILSAMESTSIFKVAAMPSGGDEADTALGALRWVGLALERPMSLLVLREWLTCVVSLGTSFLYVRSVSTA